MVGWKWTKTLNNGYITVNEEVLADCRRFLECRGDEASSCDRRLNAASDPAPTALAPLGDAPGDLRPLRPEPPWN